MAFLAGLLSGLGGAGAAEGAASGLGAAAPAAGAAASGLGGGGGGKTGPQTPAMPSGATAPSTAGSTLQIPGAPGPGPYAGPQSAALGMPDPTSIPGVTMPQFQTPYRGPSGMNLGTPGSMGTGSLTSGQPGGFGKLFLQYVAAKHGLPDPYGSRGFLGGS